MDGAFHVGPWLVEPGLNTVSRNGTSARLEPKQMEVLVCLAQHAGESVSKEKLLQAVWPDTFVSDDVLTRSIFALRRVFEDDAKDSRIIQTIPKRGYRLLAPVVWADAAAVSSAPVNASVARGSPTRWWKLVATAGLALASAVLLAVNPGGLRDRLLGRSPAPAIRSLAVLPLQNLSGDSAQEYFADGMTEELITELSHIAALRVISRTSVMRYKKSDKTLPQIARELNVDAILEGSVARSGDRVRITAQLIRASNDANMWADTFDRDVQDVLALQRAVAIAIVDRIQVELTPSERQTLREPRPVNPKAREPYLQGRYHLQQAQNAVFKKDKGKLDEQETEKAIVFFQKAIVEDPNYAPPYVGIWEAWQASQLPPRDFAPRARPMVLRALQLDDTLAEAHLAMASILQTVDWNWPEAEKEYQRAIQLGPSNADAHSGYSSLLFLLGREREGMKEAELAQHLDPKSERMREAYFFTRQFDRAIVLEQSEAQLRPSDFFPHYRLSVIYGLMGRHQEAISELQKMLAILEYDDLANTIGRVYEASGYEKALKLYASQLGTLYSGTSYIPAWYVASIYGFAGDKDQAFAWLEKASSARDGIEQLRDPQWDPLRSDPRFKDLVRRVGLPQY